MERVPCVHFLAAKYNLGTNEVTERLQSVSLLLGEDKKVSFWKSKTELASRISLAVQLQSIYPRLHTPPPIPTHTTYPHGHW